MGWIEVSAFMIKKTYVCVNFHPLISGPLYKQ